MGERLSGEIPDDFSDTDFWKHLLGTRVRSASLLCKLQRHGFSRDFGCDSGAQLLSSICLMEPKPTREIPEIQVETIGWKPS
ncbi:hypothetical protein GRJ2_002571000 [Grus japonensis]|uniref:Uncharacterized protein n=1 Tax=Grus japonensis TaxID=30415 RepID=A0ABC9XTJ6_GRUJA